MKFVIIGGDAAGMSAASRAKRKNPDIDITVLEQTHDVSWDKWDNKMLSVIPLFVDSLNIQLYWVVHCSKDSM